MWLGFSDASNSHICRSCNAADWRLPRFSEEEQLWRPKRAGWAKTTRALLIVGSDLCVANSFPNIGCAHGEGSSGTAYGRFPGHLHLNECDRHEYLTETLRNRYASSHFRSKGSASRAGADLVRVLKDPPNDIFKDSIRWLQRTRDGRVIFHYAFDERQHLEGGAPTAADLFANGCDILLYDVTAQTHVKTPITEVYGTIRHPALFIFDCPNGAELLNALDNVPSASIPGAYLAIARTFPQSSSPDLDPQIRQLPTMLLTDCLIDPIQVALRLHVWCSSLTWGAANVQNAVWADGTINGKAEKRDTPLGEIVWIFTAIVDAIAWNSFDNETFTLLFRTDVVVASIFRNYLLAERVLVCIGEHETITRPALPSTGRHPLWDTWDHALEEFLLLLQTDAGSYRESPFFTRQMSAFAVSLRLNADMEKKPVQLPILLQMLLHTGKHRLECLRLLAAYLDLEPSASYSATVVGIKLYLVKILLQNVDVEVTESLILIWTKLVVKDPEEQHELLKVEVFDKFVELLKSKKLSDIYKAYVCCILAVLHHHSRRVLAFIEKKLHVLFDLLLSDLPVLQGMTCLLLAEMCDVTDAPDETSEIHVAFVKKLQMQPVERVLDVLQNTNPTVRALATYCVGALLKLAWDLPESLEGENIPLFLLSNKCVSTLIGTFVVDGLISELNPLPTHEFLCILGTRIREFFNLKECPSSPSSSSVCVPSPLLDHDRVASGICLGTLLSPVFRMQSCGSIALSECTRLSSPNTPKLALMSLSVVQAMQSGKKNEPWRQAAELFACCPDTELSPAARRILMQAHGGFVTSHEFCSGCEHHLPHFLTCSDESCVHLFQCTGLCDFLRKRSQRSPTGTRMRRVESESALDSMLRPSKSRRSNMFNMQPLSPVCRPQSRIHALSEDPTLSPVARLTPIGSRLSQFARVQDTVPALFSSSIKASCLDFKQRSTKLDQIPATSMVYNYVCALVKANGAFGQSIFSIHERDVRSRSPAFSPECGADCNLSTLPCSVPSPPRQDCVKQRCKPAMQPRGRNLEFTQVLDVALDDHELNSNLAKGAFHCHSTLSVALIAGKSEWRVVDYGQMVTSVTSSVEATETSPPCPWYRFQPVSKNHCSACGEVEPEITQFLTLNHLSVENDPHGSMLACARDDGSFHLYCCWGCRDYPLRATGRAYQVLPRRRKVALQVGYNPYTQCLIAGGRHSDICIWDLFSERLVTSIPHKSVHCVSALVETVPAGSNTVFFGDGSGSVHLMDLRGVLVWNAPKVHAGSVVACWNHGNAHYVSSLDETGQLVHLDLRKGGLLGSPVQVAECTGSVLDLSPLGDASSAGQGSLSPCFGADCAFISSIARESVGSAGVNSVEIRMRHTHGRSFEAHLSSRLDAVAVSLNPFRKQRAACLLLREEKGSRLLVYGAS